MTAQRCILLRLGEAGGHWESATDSTAAAYALAFICLVTPRFVTIVLRNDTVKCDVNHAVRRAAQYYSRAHLCIKDCDISQCNVLEHAQIWWVTFCARKRRPAYGTGMCSTQTVGVRLLCWSDPYSPLRRLFNHNVFIQDICDVSVTPKFHVDALECILHVTVSEGDVPHCRATDGSYR